MELAATIQYRLKSGPHNSLIGEFSMQAQASVSELDLLSWLVHLASLWDTYLHLMTNPPFQDLKDQKSFLKCYKRLFSRLFEAKLALCRPNGRYGGLQGTNSLALKFDPTAHREKMLQSQTTKKENALVGGVSGSKCEEQKSSQPA